MSTPIRNLLIVLLCWCAPVHAATTVRSTATATNTTGTAISITKPSGTAAGDIVIVITNVNSGTATVADNNGSFPFTEDLADQHETSGGTTASVWSRRMTGSEGATLDFTISTSLRWSAHAITFQNPHSTDIFDVAPIVGNADIDASADTTCSLPVITTLTNAAIHLAVCNTDNVSNPISAVPTGYTQQTNGGDQRIGTATKVYASAGATDSGLSFTHTTSSQDITFSFAIKDETAGAGGGSGQAPGSFGLLGVGR